MKSKKKFQPEVKTSPIQIVFNTLFEKFKNFEIDPKYLFYFNAFVAISISTFLASITNWQLFEQDLFLLSRAGEEILQTYTIQSVDTWSSTVKGETWHNFQWLTSVIYYLTEKFLGGIEKLVYLRVFSVFVLFAIISIIIYKMNFNKKIFWFLAFLFLPHLYLMNWIRFQLRPDLFGIISFSILVLIQISESKLKNWLSLLVLILWVNLHSGTVIVGIFYFVASLSFTYLFDPTKKDLKTFFKFAVLAALTWFISPIHYHALLVLLQTTDVKNNPDLQPFTFKFLKYSEGGWGYSILFIYLSFIFLFSFFHDFSQSKIKSIYKNRFFVIGIGFVFLLLFFQKMRTVPYLTIGLLPLIPVVFNELLLTHKKQLIKFTVSSFVIIFTWFFILPDQLRLAESRGVGVSETWFPVKSVDFIKEQKPQGNMYNFFNFGGYLIYKLRDYPVFYDGREIPFLKLDVERTLAAKFTNTYEAFLKKYKINFVVESLPQGELLKKHQEFYPNKDWARVFSDLASTVYVRRIPEHYTIIDRFEKSGSFPASGAGKKPQVNLSQDEIQKLLEQAREEIKRRNQK